MASAGTGDLAPALTAYQHALKLAPTYLPALEGAAQTAFQMGRVEAESLLLRILAQRPDDGTSHALLGILEFRKRNCGDAVGHFKKASAVIAGEAEALTEYGACLAILKHNQDAIAPFTQALALNPTISESRYNLALAQWEAHHPDDALTTLQPLLEQTQGDGAVAVLAAEILESNGDTRRAVQLLREAILANPKDVDAYLQFAALSYDHASLQVGIDFLNAGLVQLPREPRLYLTRGVLLTELGQFSRGADDFESASRLDPQLQFVGAAEGLVNLQQYRSLDALAWFRAEVKAHPNEAYAQYLLAEALTEQSEAEGTPEYKEEMEAATRAVKLDPRLVAAQDLLSGVYLQAGQTDLAIEHSRAALALDANDQQAIYHLILALRKVGKTDEIDALLRRLAQLRANARSNQAASKGYRLYEVPVSTSPTAP